MTHWTERWRVLLAVFVILKRADGQILLLRRAGTGYMDGKLGLPSGHVDGNEPADVALSREAREEVGVEVGPADLRLVHTMHRRAEEGEFEYIDMFFEAKTWQGDPENKEPHKCSELVWVDPSQLPEDMVPGVGAALEQITRGEPYSSRNFS
jgi:ADP-ribose pyrophosphatase YjhB (NUDIX family)